MALELGANLCKDNDLMLFIDVDMTFTAATLDRVRLHTRENHQVSTIQVLHISFLWSPAPSLVITLVWLPSIIIEHDYLDYFWLGSGWKCWILRSFIYVFKQMVHKYNASAVWLWHRECIEDLACNVFFYLEKSKCIEAYAHIDIVSSETLPSIIADLLPNCLQWVWSKVHQRGQGGRVRPQLGKLSLIPGAH